MENISTYKGTYKVVTVTIPDSLSGATDVILNVNLKENTVYSNVISISGITQNGSAIFYISETLNNLPEYVYFYNVKVTYQGNTFVVAEGTYTILPSLEGGTGLPIDLTLPSEYYSIADFNVFTGTTLPATYFNKTEVNTLFLNKTGGTLTGTLVYKKLMPVNDGQLNTLIGIDVATGLTSGIRNTAVGYCALAKNTTGMWNTAIGARTLSNSQTVSYNTAVGLGTMFYNTTGDNNTAIGTQPLYYNISGCRNSALGSGAIFSNTSGCFNSGLGYGALNCNTTGNGNTSMGYYAQFANRIGSYNTAIGSYAGYYIANGSTGNFSGCCSVFIGAYTKACVDNASNETVIGYNTIGSGSNTVTIGNSNVIKTAVKGTVETNGNFESTTASCGLILKSPDGTRYRISVANGGTLSITAI